MNDMTVTSKQEMVRMLRKEIIAETKVKANAAGVRHGVVVGAQTKQALSATSHTVHKASSASLAYSGGFFSGFAEGWKTTA